MLEALGGIVSPLRRDAQHHGFGKGFVQLNRGGVLQQNVIAAHHQLLGAGDEVIISGQQKVSEGMRVCAGKNVER